MRGVLQKLLRRTEPEPEAPAFTPLGMLERLHAGERPDYCLYLRPPVGKPVEKTGILSVDLEELLMKAFDPLPVLRLEEGEGSTSVLPDEAFLMLAEYARLLCAVPIAEPNYVARLGQMKESGALSRCVVMMPEAGTLGRMDWPSAWPAAREAAGGIGIELSAYTAGGWLFRIGPDGKACTFRPIVNPNPEKIARAIESICGEM